MPGPQPCHCIPFIFCIVGRGLDPSGGVGDAAPYILGRELSANRRGIHLSRFLARISCSHFLNFLLYIPRKIRYNIIVYL